MDEGTHSTRKVVEKLDVEDEETRQARIQSYLEKLNASTNAKDFTHPSGIPQFDFGDRTTFPVNPPTELLSRVKAFLPQLEESNALITQRLQQDPSSIDIEHISDGMNQYIEMNLGLGVFEDRSNKMDHEQQSSSEDSEMSTSSSESSTSKSHKAQKEEEDEADYDSDESSEIITCFVPSRPIRPLPRRALNKLHPGIVVLEDKP
ncbi:hypothetical protein CPB84DRAFT_1812685 [Gymnopilus junonius]|uniref:Uncharacterized protein n=1 Tax=Gymnopilus junonius TaxID=109634 RepID=A0A9P5NZE1_GYMJU|nr:hypothetical protein CPB84DRAFT_1812685 [Gymnopilus junonius]